MLNRFSDLLFIAWHEKSKEFFPKMAVGDAQ